MSTHDFSYHVDRLDQIVSRIVRNPADLWLDHDPWSFHDGQPWLVKDGGNNDEVMIRCASLDLAETWARCFVARTPDARLDYDSIVLAHEKDDATRLRLAG